ncbi:MAG TPA: hypothetical protein VNU68_16345 [Verrucomicrobiae bacterium]|nr:hypothetical protein [Verrucomicrobiae bacterium]
MNPDRPQAIQYLRAPSSQLWRWTDGGTVVAWRDGTTIAFREELITILEWLGPAGLPSFGALILLLAAGRGKIPALSEVLRLRQEPLLLDSDPKSLVLSATRQQLRAQLEAALAEIRKVPGLPPELRSGLPARCVLAEALFEHARAERHTNATSVLSGWSEIIPDDELNVCFPIDDTAVTIRQVHVLAEGCRRHTAESLQLRLRTGLDALPKKSDVDLPPAQRARRLIDELSRDPARGAVARAARELMAAVRLPRHLGEREELATGGLADLTNRGALDRLLLSELAHDDLTLAVRIGLNEALFLRREPPYQEPPGTLGLLLDSGLRLWGVPRVLAAAVGLALAACDRHHTRIQAWRPRGREVHPVDLLSRGGLIQHLEALETDAHPGEALAAFAAAQPPGALNQTVVITHQDALQDPEFRQRLAQHTRKAGHAGFVATVDRTGTFELHTLPLSHRPPRCSARLDLRAIFEPTRGRAVPLLNPALGAKLPAIFAVSPVPLLLPFAGTAEAWTKADDHSVCAVLPERQLIRFSDYTRGGWIVAGRLPPGKTHWMGCLNEAIHLVKAGTSQRQVRLVTVPLAGGQPRVVDLLDAGEILAVHRTGEVLLLIRPQDVRAFSLVDGRPLGSITSPHRWVHGRFFASASRFYCATWDGSGLRLEPMTLPKRFSPGAVLLLFDRTGVESPWLVHRGGQITDCDGRESVHVPFPHGIGYRLDRALVSADGHRLFVSTNKTWGRLIELETERTLDLLPDSVRQSDLDRPPPLPHWKVYRSVDLIAVHGNKLCFRARKSPWRAIDLDGPEMRIHDIPESDTIGPETAALSFSNYPIPSELGCSLRVATWPNGSKAFVDSRGLLHLKSHAPLVREITLVLSDLAVAGWVSNGSVCGPPFFLQKPEQAQPDAVRQAVLEFLSHP